MANAQKVGGGGGCLNIYDLIFFLKENKITEETRKSETEKSLILTSSVYLPSSKCYLCRIPDTLNIPGAIMNMTNDIDQFPAILL